jgi:hypothetical protein
MQKGHHRREEVEIDRLDVQSVLPNHFMAAYPIPRPDASPRVQSHTASSRSAQMIPKNDIPSSFN